jgi:polar amino acid transport system permease protein
VTHTTHAPVDVAHDAPQATTQQPDLEAQHESATGTRAVPPTRRIRTRRHYGRWIFAAIALFFVAQFAVSLVRNPQWRWDVFAQYFLSVQVVEGVGITLALTAISATIGFVLGGILAVMRMSGSPILSGLASTYIWFFRAVPLVVQLVVWYNLGYLWPTLGLGTPFTTDFWLLEVNTVQLISAFTAAILGLSLHEAAYSAEIIRGGLLSVDAGCRAAPGSSASCSRRHCARSCRTRSTRSSDSSRAPRSCSSSPCPSCSTQCRSSTTATSS